MAKKSNYVFPIERNTALEVVKIVKNFYLLEGASGEELLAKRSGLSTRLLLDGINDSVITQELLNNIYANLNNEEALISIIKEKFQSIDYESALFLLRWTKDSQSPYYPRGMGEKPVEQFNEDYEFSKNLLISYINDHGLTSIKNLPGRVIRVQKEIVKEMANNYRTMAIDEARKVLTTNQESLIELRTSIKEQKQKIADLKAADENAQTGELEAKLKDDRLRAMEQYRVVKGQRRSLRDTLEERAILDRDFAEVVGGRMVNKAQLDAEREEDEEKADLLKKVLDLVKREALPNSQQTLAIVTQNVKGKFNEKEVKELLGEPTIDDSGYVPQERPEQVEETNDNNIDNNNNGDDTNSVDGGITPTDTMVQNTNEVLDGTAQDNNIVQPTAESINPNVNTTYPLNNNVQPNIEQAPQVDATQNQAQEETVNNGQEVFNTIYNQALEETENQNAEDMAQPQQPYVQPNIQINTQPMPDTNINANNITDPNNANV